jgi:hypothetical protein
VAPRAQERTEVRSALGVKHFAVCTNPIGICCSKKKKNPIGIWRVNGARNFKKSNLKNANGVTRLSLRLLLR